MKQSTMDLLETRHEMDESLGKLKATLEISAQLIQSSDKLIEEFPENRRLAEEDRRLAEEDQIRHEQTMERLEKNEREFQEEFARVMHQIERDNGQSVTLSPQM